MGVFYSSFGLLSMPIVVLVENILDLLDIILNQIDLNKNADKVQKHHNG